METKRWQRRDKGKERVRLAKSYQKRKGKVKEWYRLDKIKYPQKYKDRMRRHYLNNQPKILAYRESFKERAKNYKLKRAYGISLEERDFLLACQSYKCAICGRSLHDERDRHVDHCHTTKKVRGVLCGNCNCGLGHFKDDTESLKLAIIYLNKAYDRTHATSHT